MDFSMHPMLDDIELVQVQEIGTYDRRALAEHKPPGMAGSLLQNLGRRPTRLALWGVVSDPDAQSFIEKLDTKFRDGKPVPFSADIVVDSEIQQVVVQNLRIQDLAGKPQRFAYVLTLREFIEPVEPPPPPILVEKQVREQAVERISEQIAQITNNAGTLEVQVDLGEGGDYAGVRVVVQGETSDGEPVSTFSEEQVDGVYRFVGIQVGTYSAKLEIA
jgi:hypothetical protein